MTSWLYGRSIEVLGCAAAVLMLVLVLCGCDDITPVRNVDRCEQTPPHPDCDKCQRVPRDPSCPQCAQDATGCRAPDASTDAGELDASTDAALVDGNAGGDGGNAGTDGGGGSGGGADASIVTIECDDASDCSAALPVCGASGHCERCSIDAPCAAYTQTPRCETRANNPLEGSCVECRSESHCTDPDRPLCVGSACVQCAAHEDCSADPDAPQCTDGSCVPCTSAAACTSRAGTPECDTQQGRCVQCVAHADCPNDAPACIDGTCGACTSQNAAAACAGRMDATVALPFCNVRSGTDTFGQCVQCTGATEDAACDGTSCDQQRGRCTGTDVGTVDACSRCAADSECSSGAKCVVQVFDSQSFGPYCFFPQSSTPGCANTTTAASRKPYSEAITTDSIDGASGPFCMPVTTCQAVRDTAVAKTCDDDADCGESSVSDGVCLLAASRCTYACGVNADDQRCLSLGYSDCALSGSTYVCQP